MKTAEQHFADWEVNAFGFGYGSGEPHILPQLKVFFGAVGREDAEHGYDYEVLEKAVGPTVAWLFINRMCQIDIFEYGTSPCFGWLTKQGKAVRDFMAGKTADELVAVCTAFDSEYAACYPDACNCGPRGYEAGRKCDNPFFV